jgi:cell division protease FtsH
VISEKMKQEADAEVSRIINEQVDRVQKTLKKHRKELDAVSEKLLEVETLDADEFNALMDTAKAHKKV